MSVGGDVGGSGGSEGGSGEVWVGQDKAASAADGGSALVRNRGVRAAEEEDDHREVQLHG